MSEVLADRMAAAGACLQGVEHTSEENGPWSHRDTTVMKYSGTENQSTGSVGTDADRSGATGDPGHRGRGCKASTLEMETSLR